MFKVSNSANCTEIDIIGSIGEGWFDEGVTLETVRNQVQGITNNITINVASLGGDLMEALAIHDMFKVHPYKVTTNIIGATASAGTIIALGADEVCITENSMFLGHKASMVAAGNSDDLRAAADDLDKYDSRIIGIYQKKTGKTRNEIEDWLKEDKWITPEEALAFGLVNKIYKSSKVMNTKEELSAIKPLPENYKLPEMENNDKTLKETILNAIGFKNDAAIVAENKTLTDKVAELEGKIENLVEPDSFNAKISDLEGQISNKQSEYDSLKAELDALKVKNQENLDKIAALEAGDIGTKGDDPDINGVPKKEPRQPRFQPQNEELRNLVHNMHAAK